MITFLKNLLFFKGLTSKNHNDFSDFFIKTNSREKARVIRQVLREANEEQRELVRKYSEESESESQLKPNLS